MRRGPYSLDDKRAWLSLRRLVLRIRLRNLRLSPYCGSSDTT